jgi:hypothetical protein
MEKFYGAYTLIASHWLRKNILSVSLVQGKMENFTKFERGRNIGSESPSDD